MKIKQYYNKKIYKEINVSNLISIENYNDQIGIFHMHDEVNKNTFPSEFSKR